MARPISAESDSDPFVRWLTWLALVDARRINARPDIPPQIALRLLANEAVLTGRVRSLRASSGLRGRG